MKVILLEDVKGTGKRGDVVDIKDGYASNFLLPRRLALPANKSNVNVLEREKQHILKLKDEDYKKALELSKQIDGKEFVVNVKAGENGKLFGSITNKELAAAVLEQTGVSLDRKKIVLKEPLKTAGVFEVAVKLHAELETKIKAVLAPNGVVPEQAVAPAIEEAAEANEETADTAE